jgi:phosphoribosylanthranilate isomerase
MSIAAKICGLNAPAALAAASAGGAAFAGFIFYPPSPRDVSPMQAAALAANLGFGRESRPRHSTRRRLRRSGG